jgi:uncharacterized protein (TIGR03382 family)
VYLLSRLILLASFLTGIVCFAGLAVELSPWSWCLLVLYVFGRLVRRRRQQLWACGTAKWAEVETDLRRAGMIVEER